MKWMILLPQLPASPSTLRVMVWRRMREAGALGLQNGVWLLPDTAEKEQTVKDLESYLAEHGASAYRFKLSEMEPDFEEDILASLRADRDEEYAEFIERCQVLLDDLAQETKAGKFSYAELEEAEVDLAKLEDWWQKCMHRDFVTGQRQPQALAKLEQCRQEYQAFAETVYRHHGLDQEPIE